MTQTTATTHTADLILGLVLLQSLFRKALHFLSPYPQMHLCVLCCVKLAVTPFTLYLQYLCAFKFITVCNIVNHLKAIVWPRINLLSTVLFSLHWTTQHLNLDWIGLRVSQQLSPAN